MKRIIAPLVLGVVLLGVAVAVRLITGNERDFLIVCGAAVGIVLLVILGQVLPESAQGPSIWRPYGLGWPTRERLARHRRYAETGKMEPEPDKTREHIRDALSWLLAALPCGVAALFYIAL